MCGISGAISLASSTGPSVDAVAHLTDRLAHRGPDGTGTWRAPSGRAVLGHRRLSVIDLALGQQPMVSEDGSCGLVFNGEIYNYLELRKELEAAGERFRTASDTEVLLRLLLREGEACLDRLLGMFVFCFWDDRTGRALLARDRMGKKPLFHVQHGGILWFASSLSALKDSVPGAWPVNPQAVDDYLTLGYIPAPSTIYQSAGKLEAGTITTVSGGAMQVRRFWDPRPGPMFGGTYAEACDALEALAKDAVRLRLRSDVPLGVFLSGGIDSSLVTALAAKESAQPIRTFSIQFDHAAFDESAHAAAVAAHTGTIHETFTVHAEVLELIPSLAWHYGEPFADSSAIPTWILSQHTRQRVTVALGGDGGDEAFLGYKWYATAASLERLARWCPPALAAALGSALTPVAALPGAGRLARALTMLGTAPAGRRFAAQRSFINAHESRTLLGPALQQVRRNRTQSTEGMLTELYEHVQGTPTQRMRYVDLRTYLADCLLPKVDVASMAHGLEARAPLLDHRVVNFGLSLPDEYLVDAGGGKRILRDVLARHVPRQHFERPKQGFSLPLAPWFRTTLRPRAQAMLDDGPLMDGGWINPAGLRAIIDEHVRGGRDHSQRLYSLLMLDAWLRA